MGTLNSIINIDLHIHSKASGYKEKNGLVDESDINNIDVLLEKLNENNINMFSITDHNRFDYTLYSTLRNEIKSGESKYKNVLEILPGIEFDVKLEENKKVCHIICVFSNEENEREKIEGIDNILNKYGLKNNDNDYYTKEELENILKEIGLSVVLIAHQHKELNNPNGGKRSISNSVSNVYEYIAYGYINALEYQKPSVQGMLIKNLKDAKMQIATIIGTDCHEWKAYPKHDVNSIEREYITKIKALPTFKGLVFSVTSPETRFNRCINENNNYIKEISINNEKVQLANGINAIIGDNGSGKSLLLDILYSKTNLPVHYKQLKKKNNISVIYEGSKNIEYIEQGAIIKDVKNGLLFKEASEKYYEKIKSKDRFKKDIINYKDRLLSYINKKIEMKERVNNLENIVWNLKKQKNKLYRPKVINDLIIEDNENSNEREAQLERILSELKEEYNNNRKFYKEHKEEFANSINSLEKILENVKEKNKLKNKQNEIKAYIISAISAFNDEMQALRTDAEKEKSEYIDQEKQLVSLIVSCISDQKRENKPPSFPKPLKGTSKKLNSGFWFTKKTKYHMINLEEAFFSDMFTAEYDLNKVFDIDLREDLAKALNGISSLDDIDTWNKKIEKFIEKYSEEETYIEEIVSKESVGNTPRRSFDSILQFQIER